VAELGARAAARLGVAGHAAFGRDDLHATRNLLERATALLPEGPLRRSLLTDLIHVAIEVADKERADSLLDELRRGDEGNRAWATALGVLLAPGTTEEDLDAHLARLIDAEQTLRSAGDLAGTHAATRRFWLHWGRATRRAPRRRRRTRDSTRGRHQARRAP
jgi:hypothetical protein